MLKRCLALFFIALLPLSVGAAPDHALQQFVRDVASASGEFSQVRIDESGQAAAQPQTGTFSFQRPGKFRWDVQQPYEQLTLSDGKKLYQYDPDLAQVIVRGVDESVGTSPAAILFGSGELGDAFDITPRPEADGLTWLRAKPRSADAGFAHVDIGFKGAMPQQLLLLDSFGQTTRIEFTHITTNPQLSADEFTFSPPEGVDIVNM